ncbi:MAG: OB-fold nucleic acid binding domain-containing protein, partial [Candidatus Woesearchaeota archaeon]|nr:OB-fold nucleic acid binding domain-containing protein [Candidatus Woesearchaeota archaeon]
MESQARQTAIKTRIRCLLNGKYVVNEGWEPNHILWGSQKISRVNIIGVVVEKNQNEFSSSVSATIDDGSGRINVRSFEENLFLNNLAVGDVVVLIGRPREYSNEIYIMPEIIKPLEDKRWVEVRKIELGPEEKNDYTQTKQTANPTVSKITEPKDQIRKEIEIKKQENDIGEALETETQDDGNEINE